DQKSWVNLNRDTSLPWNGLTGSYRLALVLPEGLEGRLSFEGAVLDDDQQYKKDRILHREAAFLDRGTHCLWVDLKGTRPGKHEVQAKLYYRKGFE
ncbi:hypothetical protein, partial [Streptococcus anginosus]